MKYFLAALLLFSTSVFADTMVAKSPSGEITIVLIQAACDNSVAKEMLDSAGYTDNFKAVVTIHGKLLAACWSSDSDEGVVLIADENGNGGMIPMDNFKLERSIQ